MSAGTPNQLRPVPPQATRALSLPPNLELAPVFGPPELGKSRIIG